MTTDITCLDAETDEPPGSAFYVVAESTNTLDASLTLATTPDTMAAAQAALVGPKTDVSTTQLADRIADMTIGQTLVVRRHSEAGLRVFTVACLPKGSWASRRVDAVIDGLGDGQRSDAQAALAALVDRCLTQKAAAINTQSIERQVDFLAGEIGLTAVIAELERIAA